MDKRSFDIMGEREKGQLSLSTATSLALEGAYGILEESTHQQDPINPPIKAYRQLWVNVRTLYRNLHGSMPRIVADTLSVDAFVETVYDEMLILKGVIADRSNGRMKVVFYANTYKTLPRKYPKAHGREKQTPNQVIYAAFENGTIEGLLKMMAESAHQIDFKTFDMAIVAEGSPEKVLLMTHYPVDLLHFSGASELGLLESHTGVIKQRAQWYTKMKDGKSLIRIPFNRITLQMFGDSSGMFYPYPIGYRKAFLEVAEKNKWTQGTTADRILLCVKLARNPHLELAVRGLM